MKLLYMKICNEIFGWSGSASCGLASECLCEGTLTVLREQDANKSDLAGGAHDRARVCRFRRRIHLLFLCWPSGSCSHPSSNAILAPWVSAAKGCGAKSAGFSEHRKSWEHNGSF